MPLFSWHLLMALLLAASFIIDASAFSPPLSWDQLQATPALADKPPRPIYQDELPSYDDDDTMNSSSSSSPLPILYRDKECICAASQTVWLGLECKNVEYLTVLVSKEVDDAVPRIVWPTDEDDDTAAGAIVNKNDSSDKENVVVTDPIQLLEQIQSRYPDTPPHFYPKLSLAVDASRCNIIRLPGVMPRNSESQWMSLAPFLFRDDGTLVKKSSHCVSLEEVEEMQEEYFLGSYLCGKEVTAADMVWAPYLERYAIQLPLMFPNEKKCNPRSKAYEEVNDWYAAMEKLPAYACSVQGDARHWRKCLEHILPLHNERATSDDETVTSLPPAPEMFGWWMKKNPRGEELWKQYATKESRPWLADTPAGEVAMYLIRNRDELVDEASSSMDIASDSADEALREVIQLLLESKIDGSNAEDGDNGIANGLSDNARQLAKVVSERIEVPRDIGMIPALALGELVKSL